MNINRTHNSNPSTLVVLSLAAVCAGFALAAPANAKPAETTRLSSNPADLRDAFARHNEGMDTPQAFADFVQNNPALRATYAKHFNVPQEKVVAFIQNALVPYQLPQAMTMTTYGATRSGMIYPVVTHLKKGAKVWATREGTPVLKWNCSNPLAASLPGSQLLTQPLEVASMPTVPVAGNGIPLTAEPDTFAVVDSPSLPFTGEDLAVVPADAPVVALGSDFGDTGTAVSASLPGVGEIVDAAGHSSNWSPALLIPAVYGISQGGSSKHDAPSIIHSGESAPLGSVVGGESAPLGSIGTGEGTPLSGGVNGGTAVVPEASTASLLLAGVPMLVGGFVAMRRRNRAA